MRFIAITIFALFALAPAALAAGATRTWDAPTSSACINNGDGSWTCPLDMTSTANLLPNGSFCGDVGSARCASGYCDGTYCKASSTQSSVNNVPSQKQNSVNNTGKNVTLINPLQGGGTLESFLDGILAFVIRIGTIVVILMLIFVGYKFVAAQGKEEKIREARSALLWTVVGALILLGAVAIKDGIIATVQALSAGK